MKLSDRNKTLSEILGWPLKAHEEDHPEYCLCGCKAWNICLSACDREIDREALAKELFKGITGIDFEDNGLNQNKYKYIADHIISTMPTWLKRIEDI